MPATWVPRWRLRGGVYVDVGQERSHGGRNMAWHGSRICRNPEQEGCRDCRPPGRRKAPLNVGARFVSRWQLQASQPSSWKADGPMWPGSFPREPHLSQRLLLLSKEESWTSSAHPSRWAPGCSLPYFFPAASAAGNDQSWQGRALEVAEVPWNSYLLLAKRDDLRCRTCFERTRAPLPFLPPPLLAPAVPTRNQLPLLVLDAPAFSFNCEPLPSPPRSAPNPLRIFFFPHHHSRPPKTSSPPRHPSIRSPPSIRGLL